MTIIGLMGYAQSGKDTVGKALVERHGFTRLAYADALRNGLYALNPIVETSKLGQPAWRLAPLVDLVGWDQAKQQPEVRALLQRYGTEAGRDIHGPDCWLNVVRNQLRHDLDYVITDVRFPNEADLVHNLEGDLWKIVRDGTGPVNTHISDNLELPYDVALFNNGTLDQLDRLVDATLLVTLGL